MQASRRDGFKWVVVWLLMAASLYANHYFADVAWAIRTAIGLVIIAGLVAIAYPTAQGQRAWEFLKGARTELRKVVWPTRQETIQTTVMVVIMVIIVSLVLWGLDSLFMWGIGWLTGQRG